jgi:uncharacterized surface protein with fasciclin (FAS1) repeats
MPNSPAGTTAGGRPSRTESRRSVAGPPRVLFHLITNVWGAGHTDLFLSLTLPNVLSPANLPALARAHDVRYRIHTTPADRRRIEDSPAGRRLAGLVPVEFASPLGERRPDVAFHVHWFHRTAAQAKRAGAVAVFVPPDTLWSDGSFARCGEVMAGGARAIATPFLQVVAETCTPEVLARFRDASDGSIAIPAAALADLGRRHLHPLTALAVPGSPHGRPALERYWPVTGAGFVSRFAVRELFAFDPRRCPITFLWYAAGPEDRAGIHFAAGPHDMAMLSVDPLPKYFDNTIADHAIGAGDLARSTLHPWNDTQQTRVFARRRIHWRAAEAPARAWRHAEAASDRAMREMEVRRLAKRAWARLRELGCTRAAGVLAVALEATDLARHWRGDVPLTVLAPADTAFAGAATAVVEALLQPGAEDRLERFVRRHVLRGPATGPATDLAGHPVALECRGSEITAIAGCRVLGAPNDLDGLRFLVVDGIVPAHDPAPSGARP